MSLQQVKTIIDELDRRRRENALEYYDPYPFQKEFHCARDSRGELAHQVALICANKVGKTFPGGRAVAIHATGLYPDWWDGARFKKAPKIWVGNNSIADTRDNAQSELLGEAGDDEAFGTGALPKHLIGKQTKYHGIPNALQSVLVKHVSGGWSKIFFKAYEQGKEAWMGKAVEVVWADEEVPYDIFSQCLRATLLSHGYIFMSFTPENGLTKIYTMFTESPGMSQACIRATWDDAPHLDEEAKMIMLDALLPYEREMRSKGQAVMGSGLVWPIPESKIMCDPFKIPDSWERIAGIDFGGVGAESHPTALAVYAIDPSTGITYLYDSYRENGRTIPEHWLSMRHIGITPVAWPHDGLVGDRGSGVSYKQQYADEGANMLYNKFSNPPPVGEKEGAGGNGVKAGLTLMYTDMNTGKFKVFSTQHLWFEEFRQYYMKPNKTTGVPEIVKEGDDLMSASRYAYCSKRFAEAVFMIEDDDEDYEYEQQSRNAVTGY